MEDPCQSRWICPEESYGPQKANGKPTQEQAPGTPAHGEKQVFWQELQPGCSSFHEHAGEVHSWRTAPHYEDLHWKSSWRAMILSLSRPTSFYILFSPPVQLRKMSVIKVLQVLGYMSERNMCRNPPVEQSLHQMFPMKCGWNVYTFTFLSSTFDLSVTERESQWKAAEWQLLCYWQQAIFIIFTLAFYSTS